MPPGVTVGILGEAVLWRKSDCFNENESCVNQVPALWKLCDPGSFIHLAELHIHKEVTALPLVAARRHR